VPASVPSVPVNLTVTPQACGQNYLDWSDSVNAVSYSIYTESGRFLGNSMGSNYTDSEYVGMSIQYGTSFSYFVRSNNSTGVQSGKSTPVSLATYRYCPPPPPPSAPASVTTQPLVCGTGGFKVSWSRPTGVDIKYEVQLDGGTWSAAKGTLFHIFRNLGHNSAHTVSVRARNDGGVSLGTASTPLITTTAPQCPIAPTGVWTKPDCPITCTELSPIVDCLIPYVCVGGNNICTDESRISWCRNTPPISLTTVTATPQACGTGEIKVTWNYPIGIDKYDYQTQIDGGAWVSRGFIHEYTFTGLGNETSHTINVRVLNNGVLGPEKASTPSTVYSPAACLSPQLHSPSPPPHKPAVPAKSTSPGLQ